MGTFYCRPISYFTSYGTLISKGPFAIAPQNENGLYTTITVRTLKMNLALNSYVPFLLLEEFIAIVFLDGKCIVVYASKLVERKRSYTRRKKSAFF